jgi:hypothetical protein
MTQKSKHINEALLNNKIISFDFVLFRILFCKMNNISVGAFVSSKKAFNKKEERVVSE